MKNKRMILVLFFILLVVCLCVYAAIPRKSKKEVLEDYMKDMGKSFYEVFYYDNISKDLLKKYTIKGLKISLNDLKSYDFLNEYFADDNFKECDYNESVVMIYPYEPFNREDYSVRIFLDCEF